MKKLVVKSFIGRLSEDYNVSNSVNVTARNVAEGFERGCSTAWGVIELHSGI